MHKTLHNIVNKILIHIVRSIRTDITYFYVYKCLCMLLFSIFVSLYYTHILPSKHFSALEMQLQTRTLSIFATHLWWKWCDGLEGFPRWKNLVFVMNLLTHWTRVLSECAEYNVLVVHVVVCITVLIEIATYVSLKKCTVTISVLDVHRHMHIVNCSCYNNVHRGFKSI